MQYTQLPQPDIQRLLELQKMLASFNGIDRMVFLPPDAAVAESNVAHSFSLAMLSWFLMPHFPHLDAYKIIQLCLAHDMVEVYCGDTFSFDSQAVTEQEAREAVAIARLRDVWADFPELNAAIAEYEARQTQEALFVTALDRLQPVLMDYLCEGRTWQKLNITFEKFEAVKGRKSLAISPEIVPFYDQLKELLLNSPQLFAPPSST